MKLIRKYWSHGATGTAKSPDDRIPVFYNRILYSIIQGMLEDELGEEDFSLFLKTHVFKRSIPMLIQNQQSVWWNDVRTDDQETRGNIVTSGFLRAMEDLASDGSNSKVWGDVHQLEHPHAFGRSKPMDRIFNVGPFPMAGTNETINNLMFTLNGEGQYPIESGPAMRRIIDFSDLENSVSVLPTGQSGNLMSPHYDDQAELYNRGEFRKQMMNRQEIEEKSTLLVMEPGS